MRLFLMYVCAFAALAPTAGSADIGAAATVERLQRGTVEIDRRHGVATAFSERYAAFAPLIQSSHDLPFMARLTIKRYWQSLDSRQREQFTRAFADLSIATYASRFRDLGEAGFRIVGERVMSRGRVEIRTELVEGTGEIVAISYVLHETDTGWMIINILAEGVSDLALKRSQYQRILKTGSFDELLLYIGARRAEVEREN